MFVAVLVKENKLCLSTSFSKNMKPQKLREQVSLDVYSLQTSWEEEEVQVEATLAGEEQRWHQPTGGLWKKTGVEPKVDQLMGARCALLGVFFWLAFSATLVFELQQN